MTHHIRPSLALLFAAATLPAPALAQAMVQALPGTTDADRLAEQMRALAADPRDLNALLAAGELSVKLDDLSAAAALFARADKIDARNGRVKAGMGSILVRSERPGESLRYFQQAEALGVAPAVFAADRGLAYDLIGEQARAQRDYRLALRTTPDDDVARRYALSLAISGRRDESLAVLDPLLRKNDRAAWRTRAFVLAMGGDVAGATKIATTMMPPGTAAGLQPFFQRLPTLPAADRAFAVHFGEVVATPARLADARLVPPLPSLGADYPVQVAAVSTQPAPVLSAKEQRKRDREARRRGRGDQPATVALAANTVTPATLPAVPGYLAPAYTPVASTPMRSIAAPSSAAEANRAALVSGGMPARPLATLASRPAASVPAAVAPTPNRSVQLATVQPVPATIAATRPATSVSALRPTTAPVATVAAPPRPVVRRESGDAVLARIIAGLTIPASELVPAATAAPVVVAPAGASKRTRTAAAQHVAAAAKAKEDRDAEAEGVLATKAAAEKSAADRKLADRKAAADKKALAAKKAADAKKLADAKAAAEEKKAARANPSRIWVQVAGGANEGDLPKAWAAAKSKAPDLAGKAGYTTPLRATNRVLTGPFKSNAEAQAYVAKLRQQGIGAFAFTSDAGQKIAKLPSK